MLSFFSSLHKHETNGLYFWEQITDEEESNLVGDLVEVVGACDAWKRGPRGMQCMWPWADGLKIGEWIISMDLTSTGVTSRLQLLLLCLFFACSSSTSCCSSYLFFFQCCSSHLLMDMEEWTCSWTATSEWTTEASQSVSQPCTHASINPAQLDKGALYRYKQRVRPAGRRQQQHPHRPDDRRCIAQKARLPWYLARRLSDQAVQPW